jgi:hypothetical protein
MRLIALFRLAFATAPCRKHLASPHTVSRRPIKQKVRGQPRPKAIGLPQLVGIWFQVLLTPLEGVLFTFQSPYWFTIGRAVVLSLAGWAPHLQSGFHEPRPTRPPPFRCRLKDCHLLWSTFPDRLADVTTTYGSKPWANPLSLAATDGVSVDFLSSRYLDVSVPWVRSTQPIHSAGSDAIWLPSNAGFPHSDISGSKPVWRLPGAYRSLPRPSSPLHA